MGSQTLIFFVLIYIMFNNRAWGGVVVKALRYKSEGPGIDSRGFFPWHLTVPCALGSTQPLKTNTRIILGKRRPVRKADNLAPSCAVVMKSGGLNLLEPCGPVQTCNGTALPLCLTLNLLTTTIVAPPSNANKWQMGFNSAFKGLIIMLIQSM
jgi:hypothetical protein